LVGAGQQVLRLFEDPIAGLKAMLQETRTDEESVARGCPLNNLALEMAAATDRTPVIVNAALGPNPPALCTATLTTFVSILGAEAGNMALKVLAAGGVYLGGGIPPRILPMLEQGQFMAAFQQKGRFANLIRTIPVHVILNPKAALLGAARYGLEHPAAV